MKITKGQVPAGVSDKDPNTPTGIPAQATTAIKGYLLPNMDKSPDSIGVLLQKYTIESISSNKLYSSKAHIVV